MILNLPGPLGPEPRNIPGPDLAAAFWASSWGSRTRLEHWEPSVGLLTYLTAPAAQQGLGASWTDSPGLHEVRDLIVKMHPEAGHG